MSDKAILTGSKIMEALRFHHSFRIKGEIKDILLSTDYDIDYDQYRIMLEADILAEKIAEDVYHGSEVAVFETPETTWQMFKQTHRDSWWFRSFVKRYPVKMTEHRQTVEIGVEVKRYLKYPEADIPSPRLGRAIIHENLERLY